MADISFKIKADALGKSLENLAPRIEEEINRAVRSLTNAAYTAMIAQVQSMSSTHRSEYLKALKFKDVGNDSYLIYLDGEWANKLEQGFGGYSIKDVLLKSTKVVEVGSRAGEPWVRKAKDGHKYAAVPFEHKMNTKGSKGGDLGTDIKQMWAMNSKGKPQKLSSIFKDIDGKPISGKVAVVNDKFKGLTKYQYVHPSGAVSSVYMTYRMVSETGKDWIHPGSPGAQLFAEAEKYLDQEMENLVKTILK
jgi:hypothetical protein